MESCLQLYHSHLVALTVSDPASSSDSVDVDVIIDGKFEHGYIVTVIMGSKSTKAILYNCTEEPALPTLVPPVASNSTDLKGGRRLRRRRRKKLSTTDPRHPKPNRSGYNFFFQDQHRILKPQYPGQDRLISKMIGERWNNLGPEDKAVRVDKIINIHYAEPAAGVMLYIKYIFSYSYRYFRYIKKEAYRIRSDTGLSWLLIKKNRGQVSLSAMLCLSSRDSLRQK